MPRVPIVNTGVSASSIGASKITQARRSPASRSMNSTIDVPPISSSLSQTEADVDRQLAVAGEVRGGPKQRPQLALVVGDAARVEPAVAHLGRERIALPQLERRRRLDVEVAVTEDDGGAGDGWLAGTSASTSGRLSRSTIAAVAALAADELDDPVRGSADVAGARRDPR